MKVLIELFLTIAKSGKLFEGYSTGNYFAPFFSHSFIQRNPGVGNTIGIKNTTHAL